MKNRGTVTTICAALAVTALAGCGNDAEFKHQYKVAFGNFKNVIKGKVTQGSQVAPKAFSQEQVQSFLQAGDAPMTVVRLDDKYVISLVTLLERNGPYRTYATHDRVTMSFNQGVLSGTRGLGGDLMSADVAASLALIKGRKGGTSYRVNRYLVEDDVIIEERFSCVISVGEPVDVAMGEVEGAGRQILEKCQSDKYSIANTFVVDASGRVLKSRQWVGPDVGYASFSPIRL